MADEFDQVGPGHNQPPPDEPSQEDLFQRAMDLVANANRWRAERPAITNADMAGAAQRFILQLRAVRDDLKAKLKEVLEPIANAEALARMRFRDPLAMVDVALNGVVLANTAWLKSESDRLDAERRKQEREADEAIAEAARLSHEAQKPGATVEAELAATRAEERAADLTDKALSIPERPQIRDDQAPRAMSLRSNWKARITNEQVALKSYAKHPDIRRAALAQVLKTATREARLQKDPTKAKPGVEYFNDERAT
jgi:hypothetical protein